MEHQGLIRSRRDFLRQIAAAGAMAALAPAAAQAGPAAAGYAAQRGEGFTFLFQGDSITDGNRGRSNDWNHVMGHGYAYLISSRLWYDFPDKGFHFFNRGVSGNKVTDLAKRWQPDTLNLTPDLLSILIGINDTTAWMDGNAACSVPQFEAGYKALLDQTTQQLPDTVLVLCAPFVLPVGKVNERWNAYNTGVQQRQEIVKTLAAEYHAVYVDFQHAFNQALALAPAAYWIWDGIHPMPAGHELMARVWVTEVGKKLAFIKHRK